MIGQYSLSPHLQFKLKTPKRETEKSWTFKTELNYQIRFWNSTKSYQTQIKYNMKCKTTATLNCKNLWLTHRNHLSKTDLTTTIRNHWRTNCQGSGTNSVRIHLAVSKDSRAPFVRGNEWREVVWMALKLERVQVVKILACCLWNHLPQTLSNSLWIHRIKQMSTIWVLILLLCRCS